MQAVGGKQHDWGICFPCPQFCHPSTIGRTVDRSRRRRTLHPRNHHIDGYDFDRLIRVSPELRRFVVNAESGRRSIDFANPKAVRALNLALLRADYQIDRWEVPPTALCPPIPGRADYVHALADLLATDNNDQIPRGPTVRALDIGVGANCIYPIIGHAEYGWKFVGSDCDPVAVSAAQANVHNNKPLRSHVEIRLQADRNQIFQGLVGTSESFELSLCNPPFFGSAAEAAASNRRKREKLSKSNRPPAARRNFGGSGGELWCVGGEATFINKMIRQSVPYAQRIAWFTTLVSRAEHLPRIRAQLKSSGAVEVQTVEMAQGHKRSRFVAWSFLDQSARREWLRRPLQ